MSPQGLGRLSAFFAATLFGTSWVATRFALASYDPTAAAAWRGLGATVLLGIALAAGLGGDWGGWRALSRSQLWRIAALGLLGGLLFVLGMNEAIARTGATVAAFVAGVYPVLAAAGAPLVLGERLRPSAVAGLVLAFGGVLLLAGLDLTATRLDGLAMGLGAALAFAAYLLLTRRWAGPWSLPTPLISGSVFAVMGSGALLLAILTDPAGLVPRNVTPSALIGLAWIAAISGATAQLLLIASVRRIPAQESSAYLLLNPLTAAVLAAILLGERLLPLQLLGAAAVLAGIALATIAGARDARGRASVEAHEPAG